MNSAVSPGFPRRLMVKYTTEPRSRPTSPMPSPPQSPMPPFSRDQATRSSLRLDDGEASQRWLASPRYERRASSPHRTLVETSFCGPKLIQQPDDRAMAPRGPTPSLSSMSVNTLSVKYMTEPRSRPVSPTRNYLSASANAAGDSRRGSFSSLRCPSPSHMKVETSFCGPKQMARNQESQDRIELAPKGQFRSSFFFSENGNIF